MWGEALRERGGFAALTEVLTRWAEHSPKPLVLLIDEIDALIGDTLIAVLRQLRAGYPKRPQFFPQSVVLCGVRDVRDYRIHSSREPGNHHRRQRVQHQGQVAAHGRLSTGRKRCCSTPTQRGDRPAFHRRGAGSGSGR